MVPNRATHHIFTLETGLSAVHEMTTLFLRSAVPLEHTKGVSYRNYKHFAKDKFENKKAGHICFLTFA